MTNEKFEVVESVAGTCHYHIADDGKLWRGLCGCSTMRTSIKVSDWKKVRNPDHMPPRTTWCEECERLMKERIDENENE